MLCISKGALVLGWTMVSSSVYTLCQKKLQCRLHARLAKLFFLFSPVNYFWPAIKFHCGIVFPVLNSFRKGKSRRKMNTAFSCWPCTDYCSKSGLEFTQRTGTGAILKCSLDKIRQPCAKHVPMLQGKEEHWPSCKKLSCLFLYTFSWHLKFSWPP